MKFRSERDSLADVLTTAGRAAGGRGATSAVLSGLMLRALGNRLEVTGTDLDLTVRVEHEVIGIEDGACVVPARLTADVVRALEAGAVTLESDDEKVEISSARAHFGLRSFPVVEFPALPAPPPPSVTLPRALLVEALRQVVRAASNDDARPLLTGVLMTSEGRAVRLVATDSYRLALRDVHGAATLGEGGDVLVPARALTELQRLPAPGSAGSAGEGPGAEVGIAPGLSDITF
ncbi:MAG: DNA polymerase III subunit beta, partial [Actinomycetota bacterium]|nr:DNA polymerase III subunit beta [Actinomycetota bacterium]